MLNGDPFNTTVAEQCQEMFDNVPGLSEYPAYVQSDLRKAFFSGFSRAFTLMRPLINPTDELANTQIQAYALELIEFFDDMLKK